MFKAYRMLCIVHTHITESINDNSIDINSVGFSTIASNRKRNWLTCIYTKRFVDLHV